MYWPGPHYHYKEVAWARAMFSVQLQYTMPLNFSKKTKFAPFPRFWTKFKKSLNIISNLAKNNSTTYEKLVVMYEKCFKCLIKARVWPTSRSPSFFQEFKKKLAIASYKLSITKDRLTAKMALKFFPAR
jgi:hypothetical protein